MSKVDDVWQLIQSLARNYPTWPSTFSTCPECGKHSGRGGGPCAFCIEIELAKVIGEVEARKLHEAIQNQAYAISIILDSVRNQDK